MNILEKIKNLFKNKNEIRKKEVLELEEDIKIQPEQAYIEKIKTSDMIQFTDIKYNLNCKIETWQSAYMMLDEYNQNIAKKDFDFINKIIKENFNLSSEIKHDLQIPIEEIVFQQYGKNSGHSKFICTPYTPTGKISKYPLSLLFTTNTDREIEFFEDGTFGISPANSTHGWLYYTKNGNIGKGDAIFWRKDVCYAYRFKSDKDGLYINKIEKSDTKKEEYNKQVIYSK